MDPKTSKQRRKEQFFQNKRTSQSIHGSAKDRPQDVTPEFLLARRALLFNVSQPGSSSEMHIRNYFPRQLLPPADVLPSKMDPVQVDNPESFEDMIAELKEKLEFIVDTESHQDHSFAPFIACMQITTPGGREFVVFVPPLYTKIREELVPVLSNPEALIVGFAMKGDIASLRLEFGLCPVAVCCLQTLMVREKGLMQLPGLIDCIKAYIPEDLIGADLTKERKNICQAADWTNWPYPKPLLSYAQDDIYYPKLIWEVLKTKFNKAQLHHLGIAPLISELLQQPKPIPMPKDFGKTCTTFFGSQRPYEQPKTQEEWDKLRALWDFRSMTAACFDINPEDLFSFKIVSALRFRQPKNVEDMVQLFQKGHYDKEKYPHYSFALWECIQDGAEYVERMKQIRCHNCLFVGHIGKYCYKKPVKGAKKEYFDKYNPEQKIKATQTKIDKYNAKLRKSGQKEVANVYELKDLLEKKKVQREQMALRGELPIHHKYVDRTKKPGTSPATSKIVEAQSRTPKPSFFELPCPPKLALWKPVSKIERDDIPCAPTTSNLAEHGPPKLVLWKPVSKNERDDIPCAPTTSNLELPGPPKLVLWTPVSKQEREYAPSELPQVENIVMMNKNLRERRLKINALQNQSDLLKDSLDVSRRNPFVHQNRQMTKTNDATQEVFLYHHGDPN